eukprot:scaffold47423_cov71-Phaeocystis_antarctica.AAC.5
MLTPHGGVLYPTHCDTRARGGHARRVHHGHRPATTQSKHNHCRILPVAYSSLSTPRARRKAILADLQEKFPNVHPAPAAATGVASEPGISL